MKKQKQLREKNKAICNANPAGEGGVLAAHAQGKAGEDHIPSDTQQTKSAH